MGACVAVSPTRKEVCGLGACTCLCQQVTTGGSNRFRVKSDCKNFDSLIVDLLYLEDS